MRNFSLYRPATLEDAVAALRTNDSWEVLAGGTTMIDLLKLDVVEPEGLVDITGLADLEGYTIADDQFRFGALARMSDVGNDKALKSACPALTESLWQAASPQLRDAARLGGNILQRTRCPYFRDTSFACNKRDPGSGCAALDGGRTGLHALLGGSQKCVAMYPGDWAQPLIAFDATVVTVSAEGRRRIPFAELHVRPGDNPEVETTLRKDEIVTAIEVPVIAAMKGSTYLKARDRESYAFATVSAVAALAMDGDTVQDARIALGGVATVPWRSTDAEAVLKGKTFSEELAHEAGRAAFAGAKPLPDSAYKIKLGADVVASALLTARDRVAGKG